jgi:hypothetical protein
MAYTPTNWVDDTTPISATNMNHIEQGIVTHEGTLATDALAAHVELATQAETALGTDTGRVVTPATVKGLWTHTAAASDVLRASLDASVQTASTSYVKKKSFVMNASGTFRVKFTLNGDGSGYNYYGRIYKNGVAFGTERTKNGVVATVYSEDLAFNAGDTCELWLKTANATINCIAYYFRIYFDMTRTLNFDITPELPVGADV